MKTVYNILFAVIITSLFTACASQSRLYVSERPVAPVMVRPAPPYAGAVWIPEEYMWSGGSYVYVAPHYVHPRGGRNWAPGYWNTHRGRQVWVKGHWRR